MSNTLHEGNSPLPGHPIVPSSWPATPNRRGVAQSTPVKRNYGSDLTFSSKVDGFDEVRKKLGREMTGHWLGAMPPEDFLQKFLRPADAPLPEIPEEVFEPVPKKGLEKHRYEPFIAAIKDWMPSLEAVNTSTMEDTTNGLKLKTDISIYNRAEGTVPDRTDFAKMELWMEFKTKGVAFQDPRKPRDSRRSSTEQWSFAPNTDEGLNARGQLAQYAGALHSMQFRHFSFSIVIEGDSARFLRWEPNATIVTAAFSYRDNPRLIAEFLWRFNHLSAGERGHDQSVQRAELAPDVEKRLRNKLDIKNDNTPLYRYTLPDSMGKGYAYGPRLPTQNQSLASRCTRSSALVWIPDKDGIKPCTDASSSDEGGADAPTGKEKAKMEESDGEELIYVKDTWRYLSASTEVLAEHEIYAMLYLYDTPNIPKDVVGGDVYGGMTRSQEFLDAEWLCVEPRISTFQHYRLVHRIVGRPLIEFESTKQLVTAVFHALIAHSHAFEHANILHRDISAGNIILTDDGKGLLIDWEMGKDMTKEGSRRPERTGTWQFMSANLLRDLAKIHTQMDDIESFLHVLGWTTLRFVPSADGYRALDRAKNLAMFDEHYSAEGRANEGGDAKCLAFRGGSYPSERFVAKRPTPLIELLEELSQPFRSLYARRPPTTEDRMKINIPESECDNITLELTVDIRRYDRDIDKLRSSSFFIGAMRRALKRKDWPAGDMADPKLPISSLDGSTENQQRIRDSEIQKRQSLWGNATGVSRSSKRARSPTPDSAAKRCRGTPVTSQSRV